MPLRRPTPLRRTALHSSCWGCTSARGGSGFSFNDIAADRAGTRFGERAVQQPHRLQAALAGPMRELDLLPDFSGLPEFLPAAEFRQRCGEVDFPASLRVLANIDARLLANPRW